MLEAIESIVLFAVVSWATWKSGNGELAYVFAAFSALAGIPWLHETIGEEFWLESPYLWALAFGFLVVGFATSNKWRLFRQDR
ncbi:MAG TPA: hypothetical protein VN890_06540 [Methylocella sp.]|nr:hypothetical protein [Methylocella sp.]